MNGTFGALYSQILHEMSTLGLKLITQSDWLLLSLNFKSNTNMKNAKCIGQKEKKENNKKGKEKINHL